MVEQDSLKVEVEGSNPSGGTERECKKHGRVKHYVYTKRVRCSKCAVEAVSKRYKKVKETLVAEAGGKCVLCGYSEFAGALEFHHVDPKQKMLSLSGGSIGISRLREEAKKCVLLCSNCHKEVEYGHVTLNLDT